MSANNSFTNRMVRFALKLAAEVGSAGGASKAEIQSFEKVAEALPIPRRADGLVLQSEDFERLAAPRFDEFWKDRRRPYAAQVSQERLYRSKNLKQADVLMLMFMFENEFSPAEVKQAWEYYLPYTTHDSSLSAGIHSIMAARLGLAKEAWDFWLKSAFLDLDLGTEAAAEGIHIAGAGANWQVAVYGFAGLKPALQSDVLSLAPRLPAKLTKLSLPLVWKGQPLYIEIETGRLTVTNRSAKALSVCVHGQPVEVKPGQKSAFKYGA
jgi:trehalose/maltose hydrolase-like predicted phosphorylase